MKTRNFCGLVLAVACLCMSATALDAQTLTIRNRSLWDIYHIYISDADRSNWGADKLGTYDVLESGESIRFSFYGSGYYDLKVIDEDGDECILWDVYIRGDKVWTITDESHLDCIN